MDHSTISTIAAPYTLEELCALEVYELEALDPLRLYKTNPCVLGAFLTRLEADDRRLVLKKLSEEDASSVLSEMNAEDSAEIVSAMREGRAVRILEDLEPDDAADLIAALEENHRARLLSKMPHAKAMMVRGLLKHDPNTAGGIMHPQATTVHQDMTVDEAIAHIRRFKDNFHRLFYIYVVDHTQKLLGVLSMRELIFASSTELIGSLMETELKGICKVNQDKESVAQLMADSNLYVLPVVDEDGHLVGIIEHDDVLDILRQEATEDLQKMVGAGPDESIHDKVLPSVRKRVPWLVVNMFTASVVGYVVYLFKNQIEALSLLAVFIPILASVGGNVGAQTLAVTIRSLSLGELHSFDSFFICFKEGIKGILNGLIIGSLGAGVVYLLMHDPRVSMVIFMATILNMFIAGTAGAFVPLLLKKLNFDPAQSASIFLTAISDSLSSLIFLSLGTWILL